MDSVGSGWGWRRLDEVASLIEALKSRPLDGDRILEKQTSLQMSQVFRFHVSVISRPGFSRILEKSVIGHE